MSETFGQALRRHRTAAGLSQRQLAERAHLGQSDVSRYERDQQQPTPSTAEMLDELTDSEGHLATLVASTPSSGSTPASTAPAFGDEIAAMELARRVTACDVSAETLHRLETVFHDAAMAYPSASPHELLPRLREPLGYVEHLLGSSRLTLAAHRQLLVLGGWFSLLTATVHIDLHQHDAATAQLRTADTLAVHAEHPEIRAWCYETEAWRQLTGGDYRRAVNLSQRAQQLAPAGSSVAIQSTAQEGRAYARLGQAAATYRTVDAVHQLADGLQRRHNREHHYQYDTGKLESYTATTLAWLGAPEAVEHARGVVQRFRPTGGGQPWPRRYASANVDLALGAAKAGDVEQAAEAVRTAIESGSVVPSNHWRVAEVVKELTAARLPAAAELQAAYRQMRGQESR